MLPRGWIFWGYNMIWRYVGKESGNFYSILGYLLYSNDGESNGNDMENAMQTTALFSVQGLGWGCYPNQGVHGHMFSLLWVVSDLGPMVDTNKCQVLDRKLLDSHRSTE